jgi:hypothetical protein
MKQGKETSFTGKFVSIIFSSVIIWLIVIGIRVFVHYDGSIELWWNHKKENCNTVLTGEWRLARNDKTGRYAIQMVSPVHGIRYMWNPSRGRINWSSRPYTTFKDSCIAKTLYLEFLKQEERDKFNSDFRGTTS